MFSIGDRVTSRNSNRTEMADGSLGTVTSLEGPYLIVRFDNYGNYGTPDLESDDEEYMSPEDDGHWVRPQDIEPYHQELAYDPEQMLAEEDDL